MDTNERFEKIEKQIVVLTRKVNAISDKIVGKRALQSDDELYKKAKKLVVETGMASASLLQRKLLIGYARTAQLLDQLEQDGIVGPARGGKSRDVI
jgi:S-DNA-T family DNA segregation ATPase FtsK/SpoIIIE